MRCWAALLAHKTFLARKTSCGQTKLIPPLSTEGTGPSATPLCPQPEWLQPALCPGVLNAGLEWSWLHQTPHLRAGFEEGFQQALGGGNRPLGWEMGNAAFVLSTDEDGSRVRPDSGGIWTASVIEVGWLGRGAQDIWGVISPLPSWLRGDG